MYADRSQKWTLLQKVNQNELTFSYPTVYEDQQKIVDPKNCSYGLCYGLLRSARSARWHPVPRARSRFGPFPFWPVPALPVAPPCRKKRTTTKHGNGGASPAAGHISAPPPKGPGCQGLDLRTGLPVEPKDANCICKFCFATEVVYAHGGCQGENMVPMILATILGGWYAAFCWNPTYPRVRTEANILCKICCPLYARPFCSPPPTRACVRISHRGSYVRPADSLCSRSWAVAGQNEPWDETQPYMIMILMQQCLSIPACCYTLLCWKPAPINPTATMVQQPMMVIQQPMVVQQPVVVQKAPATAIER
eukprot:SAG25_NODE_1887_length_2197_cov_10.718303_2_plen_308_part_00